MADNEYEEDKTQPPSEASESDADETDIDAENDAEDGRTDDIIRLEEDEEPFDPDVSQQEACVEEADSVEEEVCDYKLMEDIDHEYDEDDTEFDSQSHIVKSSRIKPTGYITKYEETRVLGWRSTQLQHGAPSTLPKDFKVNGKFIFKDGKYPINTYNIATKELEYGRLPAMIGRRFPNGEKVLIPVSKLKLLGP